MKQFFGVVGFLLLLGFLLFGKSAARNQFDPANRLTRGVTLPSSGSGSPPTVAATTRPRGVPIKITGVSVEAIRPTTAPAPKPEPTAEGRPSRSILKAPTCSDAQARRAQDTRCADLRRVA